MTRRMSPDLPALTGLIDRRPELAGVGLGQWAREVSAC